MKREINFKKLGQWVNQVGSITDAARIISHGLECSYSKAEKLAGIRYPSMLTPAEQIALAQLTEISRDELFPLVRARGKAS